MNTAYDHYIALDWAQRNMAIARLTQHSKDAQVIDVSSNIRDLRDYLKQLKGKKILAFEEMNAAQWLYTELKSHVDELIVCDPYRNHLLKEGSKTDKIDATKLALLLRAGLLKPVFHTDDSFIEFRKITSAYEDLIRSGVRLKNQRAALFRAKGLSKEVDSLVMHSEKFVLEGINRAIESYELERLRYEKEFRAIRKKSKLVRLVDSVPGIGLIGAVKVAAIVVDPSRFPGKGEFLSYCGLIRHDRISGGKSYGRRAPRCCRVLKSVFKTAALNSTMANCDGMTNPFRRYYDYLIAQKGYAESNARHAVARRIAVLTLGTMKGGKSFKDTYSHLTENNS